MIAPYSDVYSQPSATLAASGLRNIASVGLAQLDREEQPREPRDLVAFGHILHPWYQEARHIRELAEDLIDVAFKPYGRLIVVMPPRHSKSVHTSELLPALVLGEHPDWRIIAASHTQDQADKFSRRVRENMMSGRYPYDVEISRARRSVKEWEIAGTRGGYMAVGRGGSPVGSGANLLIIDDPIRNQADADSKASRDMLYDWYINTLRTRCEPDASIIICATRWHEDDLTGRLLADAERGGEQWQLLHLPAIDRFGKALWPERWPVEALMRIKGVADASGSRLWDVQYQGNATKSEGAMLKRHWWGFWQRRGDDLPPVRIEMQDGSRVSIRPMELPPWFDTQAQSWDMSFGSTKRKEERKDDGLSYVVGLVAGTSGSTSYLLDCYRERVEFLDAVQAVRDVSSRWPLATAKYIEAKANGPAIISTLQDELSGLIPIEPIGTKEERAKAQMPTLKAGNWILPHPSIYPWVQAFIDELAEFPRSATNDQVDAWSQLSSELYGSVGDDLDELIDDMAQELGMGIAS